MQNSAAADSIVCTSSSWSWALYFLFVFVCFNDFFSIYLLLLLTNTVTKLIFQLELCTKTKPFISIREFNLAQRIPASASFCSQILTFDSSTTNTAPFSSSPSSSNFFNHLFFILDLDEESPTLNPNHVYFHYHLNRSCKIQAPHRQMSQQSRLMTKTHLRCHHHHLNLSCLLLA